LGGREIAQGGVEILPKVSSEVSTKYWENFIMSSKFHQSHITNCSLQGLCYRGLWVLWCSYDTSAFQISFIVIEQHEYILSFALKDYQVTNCWTNSFTWAAPFNAAGFLLSYTNIHIFHVHYIYVNTQTVERNCVFTYL